MKKLTLSTEFDENIAKVTKSVGWGPRNKRKKINGNK